MTNFECCYRNDCHCPQLNSYHTSTTAQLSLPTSAVLLYTQLSTNNNVCFTRPLCTSAHLTSFTSNNLASSVCWLVTPSAGRLTHTAADVTLSTQPQMARHSTSPLGSQYHIRPSLFTSSKPVMPSNPSSSHRPSRSPSSLLSSRSSFVSSSPLSSSSLLVCVVSLLLLASGPLRVDCGSALYFGSPESLVNEITNLADSHNTPGFNGEAVGVTGVSQPNDDRTHLSVRGRVLLSACIDRMCTCHVVCCSRVCVAGSVRQC